MAVRRMKLVLRPSGSNRIRKQKRAFRRGQGTAWTETRIGQSTSEILVIDHVEQPSEN
jgi:hypothetical protein